MIQFCQSETDSEPTSCIIHPFVPLVNAACGRSLFRVATNIRYLSVCLARAPLARGAIFSPRYRCPCHVAAKTVEEKHLINSPKKVHAGNIEARVMLRILGQMLHHITTIVTPNYNPSRGIWQIRINKPNMDRMGILKHKHMVR